MNNKGLRKLLLCVIAVAIFTVVINNKIKVENETIETENRELQSYFNNISLQGYQDSMQRLHLFEVEEHSYQVYMPSEMRTDVYVQFEDFSQLQIGDVIYQSGDPLTDIYKEGTYPIAARDEMGNILEEGEIKFYFSVFMPSVYIETVSGSMEAVDSDKSIKETVSIVIIDEQGNVDVSERGSIKARGNTSFQYEQKSYSVNLNSAQEILGMSEASEWALLANYGNSVQQLKNKIVYDIAGMMGMPHTPESTYVNLYIDNQYNGLYLLAQKVSADGGSVHLDYADIRSGMSGPYLLEFDARYKEEPVWFKTNKKSVVVKYPKTVSEEALEYISAYVGELENRIFSGDEESAIKKIDIDSWVDMYLMQEFFAQWDVEFASFYLYKYAGDESLYAGPVWDFDLAYGKMFPGNYPLTTQRTQWLKDCKDGWLGKLAEYPTFYYAMTQRYTEKMEPVVSKYLTNNFEELVGSLVSASYMNAKRWDRGEPDIRLDAENIRSWICGRKDFLKDFYTNEEMYHRVLFQFGWGNMSYYVKNEKTLGILPMEEYGESDDLENKDYGYGTIIGWEDENGNQITDEIVITEDVVYKAIYQ